MQEKIRAIISELNSLEVGELEQLAARVAASRDALMALGQEELGAKLEQARLSLQSGDITGFRKTIQQVLSKLGHVRA